MTTRYRKSFLGRDSILFYSSFPSPLPTQTPVQVSHGVETKPFSPPRKTTQTAGAGDPLFFFLFFFLSPRHKNCAVQLDSILSNDHHTFRELSLSLSLLVFSTSSPKYVKHLYLLRVGKELRSRSHTIIFLSPPPTKKNKRRRGQTHCTNSKTYGNSIRHWRELFKIICPIIH